MAFVDNQSPGGTENNQFQSFEDSKNYFQNGSGQAPGYSPSPIEQPKIGYGETGTTTERLFQPMYQAREAGQEQLSGFAESFREQAGPSRTFQDIGGQQTLQQAISGGGLESARGLVGAQYGGPAALGQQNVLGLQDLAGRLRTRQTALGSGGGLQTLLKQYSPGLTSGEARFEAKNIFAGPGYRQRVEETGRRVGAFGESVSREAREAREFGQQRKAEEEDIARRSHGLLSGRGSEISGNITQEVERLRQQEQEREQTFRGAFGDGGGLDSIRKLRESGLLSPEISGQFRESALGGLQESERVRESIVQRPEFSRLKDIPVGRLGTTAKGKSTYLIPDPKTGELVDYGTLLKPKERILFRKRQQEMEKQFDPKRGQARPSGRTPQEESRLAQLSPLYHGEQFKPPSLQKFITWDPGVVPSRGNVSTEKQRDQFNRINDLLGNLDRIEKSESPFRAGRVAADVERYLKDEETSLEAHKGTLDEQGRQWRNQVKRLRKSYRKAKSKSKWGPLAATFGIAGQAVLQAATG